MSLLLPNRYPGRFDPVDADYPQGKFKNRTAPGAKDGSYLERDWANDQLAFFGALLNNAGITPNGAVDTAQVSQLYDALVTVIGSLAPSPPNASTTVKGLVELATNAEAEAGTVGVVPDASGVKLSILSDFASSLAPNGYRMFPDGSVEVWGSRVGNGSVVFPVALAAPSSNILLGSQDALGSDAYVSSNSATGMTFSGVDAGETAHYQVRGIPA